MSSALITFIILNTLNVIIQTIKSLMTIKGSKLSAAAANAVAYGLYTVVLIQMNCNLSTYVKALIVGGVNFIAVYAVKLVEEKLSKKKNVVKYKLDLTTKDKEKFYQYLYQTGLSFNYNEMQNDYTTFYIYDLTESELKSLKEKCSTNDNLCAYKVA